MEARREIPIVCTVCGETFTGYRTSQKFCSPKCANKKKAKPHVRVSGVWHRTCAICGVQFDQIRGQGAPRIYCPPCAEANRRGKREVHRVEQ